MGPKIFQQFDRDGSGSLDMNEVPQMLTQLYQFVNKPPPNQMDIMYAMYKFDADQNGHITVPEFKRMVYFMAGKPFPG